MTRTLLPATKFSLALLACAGSATLHAVDLVYAKDGSGYFGYKDTPKLPWCNYVVHDPDRPAPPRVNPGPAPAPAPVPADAVVLFDGRDLSQWKSTNWKVADGCIESVGGTNLLSKRNFGDCQIHLEWKIPAGFQGPWYNQGNNGVKLMGLYEIQIFDSYNIKIYPDGETAGVYGQTPPLVNACRPPGEWQTYDILFSAPFFAGGKLVRPARVTVLHNGLVALWNQEIYGKTGHRVLPQYNDRINEGPLMLAGHNCPVRFRDIWVRPL